MNIHIDRELVKNKIYIVLFQLCIIANAIFDQDKESLFIPKVLMLMFFMGMIFYLLKNGTRVVLGKAVILPLLFVFYEFISCLWAFNQDVAISSFITQLQLFVLLIFSYVFIKKIGGLEDYYNGIYLSGICLVFYSLYVYGGVSGFLAIMNTGIRMGGLIGNENTYGLVFANAAIVAMYYCLFKNKKSHWFLTGLMIFFALSSGSKKAVFLLLMGVGFFILVKYGIRKFFKALFYSLIFMIMGWFLINLPIFSRILKRLELYLSVSGNASDNLRADLIRYGVELFTESPLLGYGLGNYHLFHWSGLYSHNNYIEVLVSLGIIGFILYYTIFIKSLIGLILNRRHLKPIQFLLMFSIVSSLILGYGMVQFYGKSIWILMGVILAEIENIRKTNHLN